MRRKCDLTYFGIIVLSVFCTLSTILVLWLIQTLQLPKNYVF